ncbi:hypothetical protein HZH66_012161 [Vespula vulgaris]|uniref:Uncharacterized protein n=1 Tax=Vespula vulgaris TaxID=7454 RepID=A0A834JBL9_VESVU|nr:hypothetical protein HZH66_012161 [Vespula vulgaris]
MKIKEEEEQEEEEEEEEEEKTKKRKIVKQEDRKEARSVRLKRVIEFRRRSHRTAQHARDNNKCSLETGKGRS